MQQVMTINNRPYLASKGEQYTSFLHLGGGYTASEVWVEVEGASLWTYDEQYGCWSFCTYLDADSARPWCEAASLLTRG